MHAVEADYQILHAKLFSACTPRASWKVLHANHADQKSRARGSSSPILTSFPKGNSPTPAGVGGEISKTGKIGKK